jgi:hypothetical protein
VTLQRADGCVKEGSFFSITDNEGLDREQRYGSTLSLTSALDGGGWSTSHPCRLIPGKGPLPIVQEVGWASGPIRMGSDISPPPGFKTRNFEPIASSDWCVVILSYLLMQRTSPCNQDAELKIMEIFQNCHETNIVSKSQAQYACNYLVARFCFPLNLEHKRRMKATYLLFRYVLGSSFYSKKILDYGTSIFLKASTGKN